MSAVIPVKRALFSVSDKAHIVELANGLSRLGVEIYSTGGTAKALRQAEITVTEVSDLTGFPEILDGRVKTLHPKVFGGLLGKRDKTAHAREMEKHGIPPIDLVVVNLYPFETVSADANLPEEEMLEYIDIGGSALLRAAAKNFSDVAPVCDPEDYALVLEELNTRGGLSHETRMRLAAKSFNHTAHYDAVIGGYFRQKLQAQDYPAEIALGLRKKQDLRYGENPHQKAALYAESGTHPWGVVGAKILQGKTISFNNYMDCDAAWRLVSSFASPACVIIKHNNPCGVCESESTADAFRRAYAADSQSAFGGIVGFNRSIDGETAQELSKLFLECIIAPGFHPDAREVLGKKTNLRLLEQPTLLALPYEWDIRRISGGFLIQEQDLPRPIETKTVTRRSPSAGEHLSLAFAWQVAKHVKSNAIVLARGRLTAGIGAGQMSRVDALRVAVMKMQHLQSLALNPQPLILASDGFFPFRDTVDEAAKIGVSAIIQPGGSVRDEESIAAANEHGMAMLFTSIRHFRH
ncbi:MAG: bifunctional phosphoribosylaminoimidazolecarboxamide formyltransferase/IMP cyclohydrolase [Elusimicrobia bacterium]|nr:bifunctional phosphoribosylaminoimidazolecarboxamide formyltransferase/IMP cyclohydrolase [Elusimicrobiota bacterium]